MIEESKPTQQALFNEIVESGRIYLGNGFISNGFVSVPLLDYQPDNERIAAMVERFSRPTDISESATWFVTKLGPINSLPRMLVFAPSEADLPQTDPDKLFFFNADLVELITGETTAEVLRWQFSFFCPEEIAKNGYPYRVLVVYDVDDNLAGFVAGLVIKPENRAAVEMALKRAAGLIAPDEFLDEAITLTSARGTQTITLSPNLAGVKMVVKGRGERNGFNIFRECIPGVIEALQKLSGGLK